MIDEKIGRKDGGCLMLSELEAVMYCRSGECARLKHNRAHKGKLRRNLCVDHIL